jgi:epsin
VGSENVVSYAKENMYVVKTLKEFQHIDDNGKDVGANVRQKAKDITNLLSDEVRLRDERNQRAQMRDRMAGVENIMEDMTRRNESTTPTYERPGYMDDERDLRRALEESKRLAEEEERARRNGDDDLTKALRESEREAREKEAKERETINRQNEEALFGGTVPPSDSTSNQTFSAFPQNQAFDSNFSQSANPYVQQQQQLWVGNQATGQLEPTDAFSNPAQNQQMFPQVTGFQQTNPYQQTSYNPYQQQQFTGMQQQQQQPQVTGFGQQPNQQYDVSQQFTGMQSTFQQPQQTGISNNPFGQFGQTGGQFGSQNSFNGPQQAFSPQQQQSTGFGQSFDSSNSPFGLQTSTSQQMSTPSFASQTLQSNVSRMRQAKEV